MKAVFYEQHGAPEVLQVGERPTPELQDHEVLVEVVATSVNPIDRRLRSGELQEYITRTFPVVPGWDLAGRIVEVGTKVTHWQVGDEILGLAFTWSIQHGSYAEYCPIDAASITQKPASISFEQAAALPLVSLTAWKRSANSANSKRVNLSSFRPAPAVLAVSPFQWPSTLVPRSTPRRAPRTAITSSRSALMSS